MWYNYFKYFKKYFQSLGGILIIGLSSFNNFTSGQNLNLPISLQDNLITNLKKQYFLELYKEAQDINLPQMNLLDEKAQVIYNLFHLLFQENKVWIVIYNQNTQKNELINNLNQIKNNSEKFFIDLDVNFYNNNTKYEQYISYYIGKTFQISQLGSTKLNINSSDLNNNLIFIIDSLDKIKSLNQIAFNNSANYIYFFDANKYQNLNKIELNNIYSSYRYWQIVDKNIMKISSFSNFQIDADSKLGELLKEIIKTLQFQGTLNINPDEIKLRRKNFLNKYGTDEYSKLELWEEAVKYQDIDIDMGICVAVAETGLGRYILSGATNNVGNVGNNDRGNRKSFSSPERGAKSIFYALNNEYLSKYSTIDVLSRYNNEEGAIYASDPINWQKNVKNCLSIIKGYKIPDKYPFRLLPNQTQAEHDNINLIIKKLLLKSN